MTNEELLQKAIAAIKAGDPKFARELIAQIIKADRRNEQAWLWLTQTDISHEQKVKSLQNVLKTNPDNQVAKDGLAKLQGGEPVAVPVPPVAEPPTEPEPPSLLASRAPAKAVKVLAPLDADPPPDTKQCPHCAETIKAEAKVCRFCGNDLVAKNRITASQLIDSYVATKSRQGWQVVSRTDTSVQLRKPKKWNTLGLVLGLLGLALFGLGLLILALVLIDYALQKEETLFMTAQQISDENARLKAKQVDRTAIKAARARLRAKQAPAVWAIIVVVISVVLVLGGLFCALPS